MNNWLQNIKGQLTELATEVLNEATEEGQISTGSELNVEKKRSTEAERLYLVEKAQKEEMIKKLQELEEQLYSSNIENDAIKEKFMGIVSDRDQRIMELNKQLESLKFERQDDMEFKSIDLDDTSTSNSQIDIKLMQLKEKHEHEISALMLANADSLQRIKEQYEQRLRELESWNILDAKEQLVSSPVKEKDSDEYAQLLQNYNSLRTDYDKQKMQISELESNHEQTDQEISLLKIKIYELQTELTNSKENEIKIAEEIEAITAQKNELKQSIDKIQSQKSTTEASNLEQIDLLKAELKKNEVELQRMRNERLLVTSIQSSDEFKRPSSDTDESGVSNNEWERMCKDEIDVAGGSSNVSETTKDSPPNEISAIIIEKESRDAATQFDQDYEEDETTIGQQERLNQLENIILDERNKIRILQEELTNSERMAKSFKEEVQRLGEELIGKQHEFIDLNCKFSDLENKHMKAMDMEQQYEQKLTQLFQNIETVQSQLKNTLEANEHFITSNAELSNEIETLKAERENLQSNVDSSRENMQQEINGKDKMLLSAGVQIKFLEESLNKIKTENDLLQTSLKEIEEKLMQEEKRFDHENLEKLSTLMKENDELKMIVQAKQAESKECYAKLQEFSKVKSDMEKQIGVEKDAILIREQDIAQKNERIYKLESELERLREHLMTIEEISGKEALVAEKREVDLREQIRHLQERCNNDESSIAKSMEHYQNEMMDLKLQLASVENERLHLQTTLNETEKQLKETKKGLFNLQTVLKDLADEHRMEKQNLEKEMDIIRERLTNESNIAEELRVKEQKLVEEKEFIKSEFENEIHNIRTELFTKDSVIEKLENQLEEICSDSINKENNSRLPGSSNQVVNPSCAYKIDDSTLRQLFLSFFTADKSKQPDIAIVMTKILGYSTEEQAQIRKALQSTAGNSWFGFARHANQSSGTSEPSLTEQFIRFLENESLTARAHPVLTMENLEASKDNFLIGDTPSAIAYPSLSSTDFKSILDS